MKLSIKAMKLMADVYKNLADYDEVILTQEEYDDGECDMRYEAPRVSKVDKYFYYDEYVIMNISNGKFNALGITEGVEGNSISGDIEELTYDEAVNLLGWLDN